LKTEPKEASGFVIIISIIITYLFVKSAKITQKAFLCAVVHTKNKK
jgi:hypothetical protein